MKILRFVRASFAVGLAVPAHISILDGSRPLDLRTVARMSSPFWACFCACAFSRQEAATAIRCVAHGKAQKALMAQLAHIQAADLPDTVGPDFMSLERDFSRVTMGICTDPACEHLLVRHAHPYQFAAAIPGLLFRSMREARAWVSQNRQIDGSNAHALLERIKDWPGMPLTATSSSDVALERQTA